jgi:sigma-E factor negative regulatory protein RseC
MLTDQEIHEGKIVSFSDNCIHVQITVNEACQNCKSKNACMIFNARDRIIDINSSNTNSYEIGEVVDVQMKTSIGLKAVLLAYVIPVIVLLVSIIIGMTLIKNDILVLLISFFLLAIYYYSIYLVRAKMKQIFTFTL